MKLRGLLYILLMVSLIVGCQDDFGEETGEGMTEGMVTLRFSVEDAREIYTRSGEDASQDAIENVLLMVFDGTQLTNRVYFDAVDGDGSVRVYLQNSDEIVYAFCNLPSDVQASLMNASETNVTEDWLKGQSLTIAEADGAYAGNFVMSGDWEIPADLNDKDTYEIPVRRLAAKLTFNVRFLPSNAGDQFAITGLYMYNIPKGSKLLGSEREEDSLNVYTTDYVYDVDAEERKNKYFHNGTGEKESPASGLRIDYETKTNTEAGTGILDEYYAATFYQFENRQGGVYDDYDWEEKPDGGANWPDLASLKGQTSEDKPSHYHDLFEQYRQIKKWELAQEFDASARSGTNTDYYSGNDSYYNGDSKKENGFPYASYLVIEGVYEDASGASEVKYFVYLGNDNYADFNIRRNHEYIYDIRVMAKDQFDTRVYSNALGNIQVYYDNSILDAHFNVTQALLYSQTDWEAHVENPDETPWLEISTSPRYIPRKAGQPASSEQARFSLSGSGGIQYLYIHTDEFIPKIENPTENPTEDNNIRTGTILLTSGLEETKIEVKQYAAQMVICHIKYDIHTMKEVLDTFYVERVQEKKNMAWGFEKYWSFITDDLIASGQWDGLSNTRKLYKVALEGDKMDLAPAYSDGIPSDIALGYAIGKNRDRNGNGKIDSEEIVWYLPAANELQAVYGHKTLGLSESDCDKVYMDDGYDGTVILPAGISGPFHSSSPSVADPEGITPGRSYYVNMSDGKKAIGLRSRYYNVLCARRHNAWRGNQTGETNGDVGIDDSWDGEEEVISNR